MEYLALIKQIRFGDLYRHVILTVIMLLISSNLYAQIDTYGEVDELYIDSVLTIPGEQVTVNFYMKNDEPISSVSVPVVYDPDILIFDTVLFAGSRMEYMSNKIITPENQSTIDGHFLVSGFIIFEDPIPVGNGLLFSARFKVSETAPKGSVSAIDTLFYPPGGEMIFVESATSDIIVPLVRAGQVSVMGENLAPTISHVASKNIFEGDSLSLSVTAADGNNDVLNLTCLDKPAGAVFIDNGDGTGSLKWTPGYTGPYSSDGSPFNVTFQASDGLSVIESNLILNVINQNRKPIVSATTNIETFSGGPVSFEINGSDPDFDQLSWTFSELPDGATITGENPYTFSWQTDLTDTGLFVVSAIASDPSGYKDSAETVIHLTPTEIYGLALDSAQGYSGDYVYYDISLNNQFPISGFDLLINYDPSVLSLHSVTNQGTRSVDFDDFDFVDKENNIAGNLRLTGVADNQGGSNNQIPVGSGDIVRLEFKISSNLQFAGLSAPVHFVYLDLEKNDNTLSDTSGNKIEQEAITYINGEVEVLSLGEIKVGDINLNNIAFDIGDAIYFTNFFMNPASYPFNPLQYANSDINQDNMAATVADLVAMINIITDGGSNSKINFVEDPYASIYQRQSDGSLSIGYQADFGIGAVLIKLPGTEYDIEHFENLASDMVMDARVYHDETRILIYSLDGYSMPSGDFEFISIPAFDDIENISIELSTASGQIVELSKTTTDLLPDNFSLSQNYPNPFNPSTTIEFELPHSSEVSLTVYNLLGEKVKVLINETMAAGSHQVVWNSRNDNDQPVASGVYLYRLDTGNEQLTKKMMLLK